MTLPLIRKLLSQLAILASARAIGAVCVLMVSLLITRSLGAETMAHYSLYLAAASIISVLLPIGFHAIASMIVSEYDACSNWRDQISFIKYAQKLIGIMALALFPFALCFIYVFRGTSEYDLLSITLLAVSSAIAMAYTYLHAGTLIGMQKQFSGQLPDMALRPVLLLIAIAVLITFDQGASEFKVLLISSAVIWIAALVQWYMLRQAMTERATKPTNTVVEEDRKKWWDLAPSWMVVSLLWEYFVEVHMLIAGLLVAPGEVALLYICFRLRQFAGFGFTAIESLLMPKIFSANAIKDIDERQSLIQTFNWLSLAYASAALIGVVIIGPHMLGAFGEEFKAGQGIFLVLIGTLVVRAIFGPAHLILGMNRNPVLVAKILGCSLVISLVLCFGGFQFGGVNMIAIGFFAASVFTSVAMWAFAKQKSGINCAIWA